MMDSVSNLEHIFKLLFQQYSRENLDEIISLIGPGLETTEILKDGCEVSSSLEKVLTSIEQLLKIFNSHYEARFNVFIEYIFDQIQSILEFGIYKNILSNLPLSNFISIIGVLFDIALSNSCERNMNKLAEFYMCVISPLKNNNISLSEEELTLRLKILSLFYETINTKKLQCLANDVEQLTARINVENCECNLFSKLIFSKSKVTAAQTLINIIPKYIEFSEDNIILQYIWNEILQSLAQDNNDYSRKFIVLCYLSDLYFTADNIKMITDIFKYNSFWTLLQKGLTHSDSSVRKQALFLFKASCNYIRDNDINCIRQDEDVNSSSKSDDKYENLINWECDTVFTIFKEFWCIIEYLEEKQVHLLKPIIDVTECFITMYSEKLHISWMLIIIQRMIGHDNMTIVKKGFLNLLSLPIQAYHDEEIMKDAIKIFVSVLNYTQLYSSDWQVAVDELKRYFDTCSRQTNAKVFFKLLLHDISNVRWSPEALFFVTYSLQFVESKNYLEKDDLDSIKKIMSGTLNHYTYIKSAVQGQLLNIAFNLVDSHVTLDDITSLLTCFVRKTCLQRRTILWEKIVKWVRNSYATGDVEKFIKKSIDDTTKTVNIGKMILIVYDAYFDNSKITEKIKNLLETILTSFADIRIRLYSDVEALEFYLSVICDFMEESYGDSEILKIFSPSLPDILMYIEMKLDSMHHIRDFQRSQNFLRMLDTVFNFSKNDCAILEVISNWFEKIIKNVIIKKIELLPLQKFIQVKILTLIIINNICFISHPKMEYIGSYLKTQLCAPLEKTSEDLVLTKDLQTLWGKMNSEHLKRKWQLLSHISDPPTEILGISNSDFLQLCLDAVDTGGSAVLLPLINVLGRELPSLLSESQITQIMDNVLNVMTERKKNDDFYQIVQNFIEATFQLIVMETDNANIKEMLLDHSQQLFSENNVHAANIFLKHIQNLEFHAQSGYFFLDLLPRALLFGPIKRKDERLISNICSVIENENLSPLTNDFSTHNEVRARAISIVLSLNPKDNDHSKFAEDLIDSLIRLEENISKNKTRYFSDSRVHRSKERLMQSLLLLESYITQDKSEKLWEWLCNKIILENNQPSVRYLQEWLMLRLMYHNPHLKNSIWKYFDEGIEKRTGSLCSLITVVHHSVKCIPTREMEPWIDKAVQTFLPYCMAQHFSVRLYAQLTLQKLMNLTKRLNLIPIVKKYGVVCDSLSHSIKSGNAVKNCIKMQEDFYFTVFDPVEHYSLETIFYDFPRLTCVGVHEWISPSLFQQHGLDEKNCSVPLKNENDSLKFFTCGRWIIDGSKQVNIFEDFEENKEVELSNFQKKMIPVKCLVPDWEELLQFVSYSPDDKNNKEGLIVVASLIDRLPNLGGLTRTCEVFGASEFVIGSLKYLEDQQFKSLSVTAEKWIPITEVKPYHLSDYLMKMKQNGYTILAAEQTINSQPLESVKFPKKSVLLLGNEKEGIPPTLLPLMDVCIEIPQRGLIRSLNVHVTGALFVWEYVKQHNFMKS